MNNGTMQVLNLLIGIFLGRLLTPGEYGLVGVLTISRSLPEICRAVASHRGLST